MRAKLFIKLFISPEGFFTNKKPVLNNQLEHDYLPLFCHGIT